MKNFVLDLLGVPEVVYHVAFMGGGPHVAINEIGAGEWVVGTTSAAGENADPPRGALGPLAGDALALHVTRSQPPTVDTLPDDQPSAAVQCLIAIPHGLSRFTLTANYEWIADRDTPMQPRDAWAAMLVARDGGLQDIDPHPNDPADPMARKTKTVGATHHWRSVGGAHIISLGVARAAADPMTIEPVDVGEAYPKSHVDRSFTLEADVDCASGNGWSRMRTNNHTWAERPWKHTFLSRPGSGSGITGVGVGAAVASGDRTARIHVSDFRILRWRRMPALWRPIAVRLARLR